jgi:integrase/recombinase XerD
LDARPHEVTLKNKAHYAQGEIRRGPVPNEAKTAFPYVRDWLNEHPFRNKPNARLICNLYNGSQIIAKTLWNMMKQLRKRIIRMLEYGEIKDQGEKEKLQYLLRTKKFESKQASRYIKTRMGDDLKRQILHNGAISDC